MADLCIDLALSLLGNGSSQPYSVLICSAEPFSMLPHINPCSHPSIHPLINIPHCTHPLGRDSTRAPISFRVQFPSPRNLQETQYLNSSWRNMLTHTCYTRLTLQDSWQNTSIKHAPVPYIFYLLINQAKKKTN